MESGFTPKRRKPQAGWDMNSSLVPRFLIINTHAMKQERGVFYVQDLQTIPRSFHTAMACLPTRIRELNLAYTYSKDGGGQGRLALFGSVA